MENQLAQEELSRQKLFMADVAEMMKVRARGPVPMAYVRTYGCQQNVADGEKIKGQLSEMGFKFAGPLRRRILSSSTPALCGNTPKTGSLATWGP